MKLRMRRKSDGKTEEVVMPWVVTGDRKLWDISCKHVNEDWELVNDEIEGILEAENVLKLHVVLGEGTVKKEGKVEEVVLAHDLGGNIIVMALGRIATFRMTQLISKGLQIIEEGQR